MKTRRLVAFVVLTGLCVMGGATACGPSPGGSGAADSGTSGDGGAGDAAVIVDGAPGSDASTTADSGMQGCNPQDFVLQKAPPPLVYLVVDRSGSMLEPGSAPPATKWDELVAAMDAVLTQFEDQIQFGLLMYPTGDECATSGPQVQVTLGNRLAVLTHLNEAEPAGGTPTAAALTNAAHALEALSNTESERFLILATDGGPNCNYSLSADPSCQCNLSDQEYCCTNYPSGECYFGQYCLDDAHTAEVIDGLHQNGIDTFVIGLAGTAQYAEALDAMADAGGRAQAGPTHYYDAADQAALTAALTDIAGSVISCRIELEEAPQYPDLVHVYMDGSEVARDPANGWDYTDSSNTAIELYGEACEWLKDGDDHVITATFACEVE